VDFDTTSAGWQAVAADSGNHAGINFSSEQVQIASAGSCKSCHPCFGIEHECGWNKNCQPSPGLYRPSPENNPRFTRFLHLKEREKPSPSRLGKMT
jgi:hypothetical protein